MALWHRPKKFVEKFQWLHDESQTSKQERKEMKKKSGNTLGALLA
jgi:hypothetical protein